MRHFEAARASADTPLEEVENEHRRDHRPVWAALGVCAVFYLAIYIGISLRQDFTTYGDVACDQRAVIGAREFQEVGFKELAFTQVEDGGPEIGLPGQYYYRHPSGGVVLLALAQMAGLTLPQARAIPLFFTTIGLFGLFLFFREATGRPWLAVVGTAFYASLAPIWLLADSYQFYSYALFVKGLAFWLIAAGVRRSGAARLKRFAALALVLVLAVAACGLETIPAIGLMSVFFPLFLAQGPPGARVRVALLAASSVAAGIVVGLGLHTLNVAATGHATVEEILRIYVLSLRSRSLDKTAFVAIEHPYPVEVLRRCAVYMPQAVVAAGAAVLWSALRFLGGDRNIRVPEWRLLLAAFLSEGLYFVFMQGHVRAHFHTSVHLTVFMATLGMVSLAMLRGGFAWSVRDTVFASLASAALLVATLVAPMESAGNLHPPFPDDNLLREEFSALEEMAGRLPRDAVVAAFGEIWEQFPLGYVLARKDLPMIGVARGRVALELAQRIERPYFALVTQGAPVETRRLLRKMAPVIAEDGRFTIYGLANFDRALISTSGTTLSWEALGGSRLVSPAPEDLERARVNYGLFGNAGNGLWMLALGKPIRSPTVVRIEVPEDERVEGVREVSASFRYDRRETLQQPVLTATVRVWTAESAASRSAAAATIEALAPGMTSVCRVELPTPGVLARVDIELRIAPAETDNAGAVVIVREIRYVRR